MRIVFARSPAERLAVRGPCAGAVEAGGHAEDAVHDVDRLLPRHARAVTELTVLVAAEAGDASGTAHGAHMIVTDGNRDCVVDAGGASVALDVALRRHRA